MVTTRGSDPLLLTIVVPNPLHTVVPNPLPTVVPNPLTTVVLNYAASRVYVLELSDRYI